MAKIDLQTTEIYLYTSLLITAFILFLFYIKSNLKKEDQKTFRLKNQDTKKEDEKLDQNILEVFDYLGTKIIHENGTYTVNHKGKVHHYKSWLEVPSQFKKMVVELDKRSNQAQKKGDYFLEIINGVYKLTLPNGSIKKYKRLSEIPEHIRKAIGK